VSPALKISFTAKYADVILHCFLQVAMYLKRTVAVQAPKRCEQLARCLLDLAFIDCWWSNSLCMCGRRESRAPAEDKQVGKRVAAEPVRAVQSGGGLAREPARRQLAFRLGCLRPARKERHTSECQS